MPPRRRAPPPPPVDSSMETESGGSDSDEEIAHSPPTASSHRTMAPPPHKVQQPESSDEEDEEEEGEEEEEEEEEQEEPKVNNYTAPPPAATNPPPPPPANREESESDEEEEEEEEEETDDEAPPLEPVPKQVAVANGVPPPPVSEDNKKPAVFFQRAWSKNDEVRILETLAAHRREHGALPKPEALEAALAGSLDNTNYGRKELMGKVTSLKAVYSRALRGRKQLTKDHDRLVFDLCKDVWGSPGGGGGGDKPASGPVPSDFGEMCRMYPFLGEMLKAADRKQPGLYKRQFSLIGSDVAQELDQKIKKLRMLEMKVELRRLDLDREVIKALMDLVQ